MKYLITGATGNIGSRVVEQLLELGHRPRTFVRSADKIRVLFGDRVDVAIGNLNDPTSLPSAFEGIDVALLVSSGHEIEQQDRAAVTAAKEAGVSKVVKLSSMDVQRSGGSAVGAWHAKGEALVRSSGMAHIFVQPGGFMSNALSWAHSIRNGGVVRASTGDGRLAMIHPDDIAAVLTQTLISDRHNGETLPITGPVLLNYAEMIGKIGQAIGKSLTFETIDDRAAKERLIANVVPEPVADALVALWRAVREGQLAVVTDNVERVLGRKPATFDEWAAEHASEFK